MDTQLTVQQVILAVILQAVGFGIYWLRTRTAAAKRDADTKAALAKQKADNAEALKKQEADLRQRIADTEAENERRMAEAAFLREQGHREEQKARAEIEKQLIESNNRFADVIDANRKSTERIFDKMTEMLELMLRRLDANALTHESNGKKIDNLGLQIKSGFDKVDLVNGEQVTKLEKIYTHIGDEAMRVITAVTEGGTQIATKLATFDPAVTTVTAIAADIADVVKNVRDLQNAYAEAIPKILASISKRDNEEVTLAERFEETLTLVKRLGDKVDTTEGSVVRIEEHIQAIQRGLMLKLDEPPLTEEDTAEMPLLNSSGDVPPQGAN